MIEEVQFNYNFKNATITYFKMLCIWKQTKFEFQGKDTIELKFILLIWQNMFLHITLMQRTNWDKFVSIFLSDFND
jgi:hypothetical protein